MEKLKIVKDYPSVKDGSDSVKKQLKAIQNKINKKLKILNKANAEVCKVLEVKKVAKSVSEERGLEEEPRQGCQGQGEGG